MAKGIAVGLKSERGHAITKHERKAKPSYRKGKLGKRRAVAREVAREVAGFAPYERRIMELLRNNLDKRALRLAKRRVGTHQRGKRKREEMAVFVRLAKVKAAKKAEKEAKANQ